MDLLKEMRREKAVYWATAGTDVYSKTLFAAPREIDVRWNDVSQLFLNKRNQEVMSKAVVFAGEVLDIDGVLRRGDLTGVTDQTNPFANTNALEIQSSVNVKTLDYDDELHVVTL